MDIKKILYASTVDDRGMFADNLKSLLSRGGFSPEEIVSLTPRPASKWKDVDAGPNTHLKTASGGDFSANHVLNTAEREGVSLITLGINGSGINDSFIKKIVKKTPCPALFYNHGGDSVSADNELFSHALLATDWSPAAGRALEFVLEMKRMISELEIVNVINKKLTVRDMRVLKDRLAETRKRCLEKEINAESHIYAGKTPEEIVLASRDYRATMIIIGGPPKNPAFRDRLKGSTSYRVLKLSGIPVLIVP